MARDRADAHFLPHPLARHPGLLFRNGCILVPPQRKFEIRRMVFEILAADIAVRTNGLGAWVTTVRRFGLGLVAWLTESLIPRFCLGFIPAFSGGLAARFASSPIRWAASSPIRWFGSKLVEQIGL